MTTWHGKISFDGIWIDMSEVCLPKGSQSGDQPAISPSVGSNNFFQLHTEIWKSITSARLDEIFFSCFLCIDDTGAVVDDR